MKNLTSSTITVQRPDGSRFILTPAPQTPQLVTKQPVLLGCLDDVAIYTQPHTVVDFGTIPFSKEEHPYIVTREIFDALPSDAVEFITPDYGPSAVMNTFQHVHAVTRFIAKADAVRHISKQQTSVQQSDI